MTVGPQQRSVANSREAAASKPRLVCRISSRAEPLPSALLELYRFRALISRFAARDIITVTGVNEGHGIGVWGEQRNNTGHTNREQSTFSEHD